LAFFKDKKRLNDFTTREELALNFISFAIFKDATVDLELAQAAFDRFVRSFNQLGKDQLSGIRVGEDVSELYRCLGQVTHSGDGLALLWWARPRKLES
jgi:hypothetical protein